MLPLPDLTPDGQRLETLRLQGLERLRTQHRH
jgi:hypothetical protein